MGLSSQNKGVRTTVSELDKRPTASLLSQTSGAATKQQAAIERSAIHTGFQEKLLSDI